MSARTAEDRRLLPVLWPRHQQAREEDGAIKVWHAVKACGLPGGRHRVARLRKLAGLEARRIRRFRVVVEHQQLPPPAPNVLGHCCVPTTLNRVWVGDFTHVPTRAGWLYGAGLLELYARRGSGWAMSAKPAQHVTLEALAMAGRQRRIRPGLIHHADQGAPYSGLASQRRLTPLGMTPSMSRKGNWYDHAVAESFFSTRKTELVHHQTYHTRDEARRDIFALIEGFSNRQRLPQPLRYLSPLEFERRISDS